MASRALQYVFPGGRKRTIVIAATAGNVATNLSPGGNFQWLILHGRITLVADANAANRLIQLSIQNAAAAIIESLWVTAAITAGLTHVHSFGEVNLRDTVGILSNSYAGITPLLIDGTDRLNITIAAGLVGDSYSGLIDVLEVQV